MEKKVDSFEDLIIWKESVQLSIEIYNYLKKNKDFGLKDQIQRSSVSIPSNIAEGFERDQIKSLLDFYLYLKVRQENCAHNCI